MLIHLSARKYFTCRLNIIAAAPPQYGIRQQIKDTDLSLELETAMQIQTLCKNYYKATHAITTSLLGIQ